MTLRRVLGLAASRPWWLLFGGGVAAAAVIANVALVGMSAYLISRAQTASNVADLALAITAVRVLAIGRAVARYVERIVVHAGTFRVLADLRSWFFASIEPLAPARLRAIRSGDLLARITADVGTLEEAFAGVAVPPVAAAAALAFGAVLLGAIAPAAGLLLLGFAADRRPRRPVGRPSPLAPPGASQDRRPVARDRARARRGPRRRRPGGARSRGGPPLRVPPGVRRDGRRDGAVDDDPGGRDRRRVRAGRRMRGRRALGGHRRRARGHGRAGAARRAPARGDRGVRGRRAARGRCPAAGRDGGRRRSPVRARRRRARGRRSRVAGRASVVGCRRPGRPSPPVRLRSRRAGRHRRPVVLHRAGRPARHRRPEWRRQVDAGPAAAPVRGLRRRRDPPGRPRRAGARRGRRPGDARGRAPARRPVRRIDPRQPRARRSPT